MNKNLFLIIPLGMLLLTSCGGGSSANPESQIEYYPVKEEENGKWGFVGRNGELLVSDEFKNAPSPAVNGVFYVEENDKYALYKVGKKPDAIKNCDDLLSVGYLMNGVIPVSRKGERISLVNGNGEQVAVLNPVNGKEITRAANIFSDGLLFVENEEGKYGFVNTKGEVVIEPKYNDCSPFSDGIALVIKNTDDSETILAINKKGEEIFKLKDNYYPLSNSFKGGYLPIKDKERYGFINKNGEFIKLPGKVEGIGDYNSHYFAFRKDSNWGIMKMNEDNQEEIIKAKYGSIQFLPGDKFLISDDSEYYVVNSKGDKEFEFDDDYKYISPIDGTSFSFIGYDKGGRGILLDSKGKPINKLEFISFYSYLSGMSILSDYFSVDNFVQDLVNPLTDKGIDKYYIGEPANSLGLEASEYSYSRVFSNEDLNKQGYRYNIEFQGKTNEYIATSHYEYNSYTGGKDIYSFNPNSKVDRLGIEGCAKENYWSEIKSKLYEGIKSKGYKLDKEEEDGDYAYFSNANVKITVRGGGSCIRIIMEPAKDEEEVIVDEFISDTIEAANAGMESVK